MTPEAQIQADVDALRQSIGETQALYREVCAVLFFRYGITPTANKLYQYVRKGSMSAPAEALGKFWEDLREKSRVRIEHPDLPDTLKTAAGELVATLWGQARAAAQNDLITLRADSQSMVALAETARIEAEQARDAAAKATDQARQAQQVAADRALQLERDLAGERAKAESLTTQLNAAGQQQLSLEAALSAARRDFADELEKSRQALQRSEERFEGAEKRALLEIDRERTAATKLQKELTQAREVHAAANERHQGELSRLQAELGQALQKLGGAEGTLLEMRSSALRQEAELQSCRAEAAQRETQMALLTRDIEALESNKRLLEQQVADHVGLNANQSAGPVPKTRRKKAHARGGLPAETPIGGDKES